MQFNDCAFEDREISLNETNSVGPFHGEHPSRFVFSCNEAKYSCILKIYFEVLFKPRDARADYKFYDYLALTLYHYTIL